MRESEKFGFTCEEVPFDFSTFNRFFGPTTDWVDEGSSTFPKVQRDSLYPPMSPGPLKEDLQVWNGSQRPNSADYLKVREVVAPKGTEIIPKQEFEKELGGKPHKVVFDIPNCKLSYKDGMIVVDELTKLPIGITATNMSQDDLKQSGFPILFVKGDPRKSKSKKHYKPKFTL